MAIALRHPIPAATARPARGDAAATPWPARVEVGRVRLRSVFRFALFFFVEAAALLVLLAVAAWHVLMRVGSVAWFEGLMVDLGFDTFAIEPDRALRVVLVGAGVFVVVGTAIAVVAGALFNLVSRYAGGIEVEVRQRSREEHARVQEP